MTDFMQAATLAEDCLNCGATVQPNDEFWPWYCVKCAGAAASEEADIDVATEPPGASADIRAITAGLGKGDSDGD